MYKYLILKKEDLPDRELPENFNAGVEAAAQLIEANEQWFEGPNDHIRFAEEIRDLKE